MSDQRLSRDVHWLGAAMQGPHAVMVVEGAIETRGGDDRRRARLIDSDGARTVGNGALHVPFVIERDIESVGGEVGAAGLGAGSLLTKLHVFEDLHCRDFAAVAESDVHPAS